MGNVKEIRDTEIEGGRMRTCNMCLIRMPGREKQRNNGAETICKER